MNNKIKVGDIFCDDNGVASFYQVVQIYNSGRVRIREIEKNETPTECGDTFKATPIPNKFKPKEEYKKIDNYVRIKDNDKGTIKLIQQFDDGNFFISFYTGYACIYIGKAVNSTYYYW